MFESHHECDLSTCGYHVRADTLIDDDRFARTTYVGEYAIATVQVPHEIQLTSALMGKGCPAFITYVIRVGGGAISEVAHDLATHLIRTTPIYVSDEFVKKHDHLGEKEYWQKEFELAHDQHDTISSEYRVVGL